MICLTQVTQSHSEVEPMAVARIVVSRTVEVEGQNLIHDIAVDVTGETLYAELSTILELMMNALEKNREQRLCKHA